jgi:hypothetical protein
VHNGLGVRCRAGDVQVPLTFWTTDSVSLRYRSVSKFDTAKPTHVDASQADWLASVLLTLLLTFRGVPRLRGKPLKRVLCGTLGFLGG